MEKEITIPEGFEATIDGNKIILKKIESENEKIRKDIISFLRSKNGYMNPDEDWDFHNRWLPWLEKQKTKKSEWLFEKGKWYVKLQHHYEGDLRHFEKGMLTKP